MRVVIGCVVAFCCGNNLPQIRRNPLTINPQDRHRVLEKRLAPGVP